MTMDNKLLKNVSDTLAKQIEEKKAGEDKKAFLVGLGSDIVEMMIPLLEDIALAGKISKIDMLNTIKHIKVQANIQSPVVNVPEIKIPEIKIPKLEMPKIDLPKIEIPKINIPAIKMPKIQIPEIKMPDKMTVEGEVSLKGIGVNNPLSVQLRDAEGKPVKFDSGGTAVIGGGGGGGNVNKLIASQAKGIVSQASSLAVTLATDHYDEGSRSLKEVTLEHSKIHSGDHYNYADYDLGVDLNEIINFTMTTPNTTEWTHLVFEVYSSAGATIELYEGATGISVGTAITPRNNNRNSTKTSSVTLLKDPTIVSDGTRAGGYLAGANKEAGFAEREREFVLKQNTSYLVRIKSLANSNQISWDAEWYEHITLTNT